MKRFAALPSLFASIFLALPVLAAQPLIDTSGQRIALDAYQMCAQLHLPDDFSIIQDVQHTVAVAVDACQAERMTLAGQFALENPGTTQTLEFINSHRRGVMAKLAEFVRSTRQRSPPALR